MYGKLLLLAFHAPLLTSPLEGDQARWPQWRGPQGTGVAPTSAPTHFGPEQNVKWVAEIPGRGFSTPVAWGERLFLTSAVPTGAAVEAPAADPATDQEESREGSRRRDREDVALEQQDLLVLALDRAGGEVLWERRLKRVSPHEGFHRTYGSYASISPVTDGERLWVSFGSFGLWCLDLAGETVWEKDLGVRMRTRNAFGEGSSPVLAGDSLVHVYDHEGESFIVALDMLTGEQRWRAPRDEPTTWAAPLPIEREGRVQVVVSGTKRVRCYDVASGDVVWECGGLGLNPIPIPLLHDDTVLLMTGYRDANMMAVALGGTGDLTGTEAVRWQNSKGLPYTASPVLYDGRLYTVTDRGFLSCFDASTGEPHFVEERIGRDSQLKSSPIVAGGRLYVATEAGEVHVIEAGTEMKVLATNEFADRFFVASPIAVAGDLFLRSAAELFCISGAGD